MKYNVTLFFVLIPIIISAQNSKISILNKVLNDSIICCHIADYGKIDTTSFVLFGNSGYYFFNHGIIKFEEQGCEKSPSISGIITKLKETQNKAIIKIFFNENSTYYTKVKLERLNTHKPWRIKSRMIYRNFQFPIKQPWLIYYSFDS
jgi:hypothetical protein